MIVRAHECVSQGVRLSEEGNLITVFTAPKYGGDNGGAIVEVSRRLDVSGGFRSPCVFYKPFTFHLQKIYRYILKHCEQNIARARHGQTQLIWIDRVMVAARIHLVILS